MSKTRKLTKLLLQRLQRNTHHQRLRWIRGQGFDLWMVAKASCDNQSEFLGTRGKETLDDQSANVKSICGENDRSKTEVF